MRLYLPRWFGLLALLLSGAASAIEGGIDIAFDAEQQIFAGSKGVISLTLKSDGFNFADQRFSLPQVPGALLLQGDNSAVKGTTEVDGAGWQTLTYDIWLFPQRPGRIEIPSFPVSFSVSMGYGQEPQTFQFETQPLGIDARPLPGAPPGQSLVSVRGMQAEAVWDPQPAPEAMVGDAYTLKVTLSAEDVPGMVLPVMDPPVVEGMGVYPEDPKVEDKVERGQLTGRRSDAVTFVCERAGKFEIPASTIRWWNPETKGVEELKIEAVALDVAPNPAHGSAAGGAAPIPRSVFYSSAAALLALLLLWRSWGPLRARRRSWKSARDNSEEGYFKRLRKACRNNQAPTAYRALMSWLLRWYGIRETRELLRRYPNQVLERELQGMQQALLEPSVGWKGEALEHALCEFRKEIGKKRAGQPALVQLNPR